MSILEPAARWPTKLILSLDGSYRGAADFNLLWEMAPIIDGIKLGLEAENTDDERDRLPVAQIIYDIAEERQIPCGLDLRLHEVGRVLENTLDAILKKLPHVSMLSLHASVSDDALRRAVQVCRAHGVMPIAATIPSDMGEAECIVRYKDGIGKTVANLARIANACGVAGVECCGPEVSAIRNDPGLSHMVIMAMGIRPAWYEARDEHQRVMTPAQAAQAGADYVVLGRPIMQARDPVRAAIEVKAEIDPAWKVKYDKEHVASA